MEPEVYYMGAICFTAIVASYLVGYQYGKSKGSESTEKYIKIQTDRITQLKDGLEKCAETINRQSDMIARQNVALEQSQENTRLAVKLVDKWAEDFSTLKGHYEDLVGKYVTLESEHASLSFDHYIQPKLDDAQSK